MAAAGTRPMSVTETFVSSGKSKKVPHHLLETKIYSKISHNAVLETSPSVVHFSGFEIGKKHAQVLRVNNISADSQRMHIIPPATKYFNIMYTKKEKLVAGLFLEITIEFFPDEWRYYYDCIRIHSRAEENLLVPIHAYPVMSTEEFPKDVHFSSIPVGESKMKIIPLRCSAPVDFEFQLTYLQSHPAFKVEPIQGVIPGNGEAQIKVIFTPMDFTTAHMKLQLLISQFYAQPLVCAFTGTSEPGLSKRRMVKNADEIEISETRMSNVLDPLMIDPLGRARLKKLKTRPWTADANEPQEIVRNGLTFPTCNLDNPNTIGKILIQQPGKLKAKQIRQAVQSRKDVTGSSKQMKETKFEYEVQQNILEERQNKLRWCVRLGEDPLSDVSKRRILEARSQTWSEYKLHRGDPVPTVEFDRSCTGCRLRRVHRQAGQVSEHEAKFDLFVNDDWSKRHMVLQRFIQAGRKVVIRLRAGKNLRSLSEFVMDWRKGKFTRDGTRSQLAESEEEKILDDMSFSIRPEDVHHFSFPTYKSPDTKDDMDVDALGTLEVQPTIVNVKTNVPYHNLKVPQQHSILGYSPHSVALASTGYVSPNLVRSLRVGAEDEVVNITGAVPLGISEEVEIQEVQAEDEQQMDQQLTTAPSQSSEIQAIEMITEPEAVPLVVPAAFFKPTSYHPMHIFNPSPGLQVFKFPLPYAETDEDYHLCPLRRNRQPNRTASGKSSRRYLDRQDVIPGVMTWKRFPCQPLVTMSNNPTLSSVWIPRWTDSFSEDLLPVQSPELLDSLPDDDVMSDDDEYDDERGEKGAKGIQVPTPEMVRAQFPTAEGILEEHGTILLSNSNLSDSAVPVKPSTVQAAAANTVLVTREQKEKELSDFIRQKSNRLGQRIQQRLQSLKEMMSDDTLIPK